MFSMSSAEDKDNVVAWIIGVVIIGALAYGFVSAMNSYSEQAQQDQTSISDFKEHIDSEYGALLENAQGLVSDIDQECAWLYSNIGSGVGNYCNDNANRYYHDIQGDSWSADSITYDDTAPTNTILDEMETQANEAYNSLLQKAERAQDAFQDECGWLSDNVSETVGDDCQGSINGLGYGYSSSPFDASNYYIE